MKLDNQTPFECERYAIADKEGNDLVLVVIKGTYDFDNKGVLSISDKQEPVEMADLYYGEPGETSIRYAFDFSFDKTATDIALIGHAYAPGLNARESYVRLMVGKLVRLVKVFGDREWKKRMGFLTKTAPEAFDRIPIIYERAFGGVDKTPKNEKHHEAEQRNPIGVGFRAKKGKLPKEGTKLPNFEDPDKLVKNITDRPPPSGFGFIAPSWEPRLKYAGTYDKTWQEKRMPLLPDDFDSQFFNAAHHALVYPGFIEGNESVEIAGASPMGTIRFDLPGITPQCVIEEEEETPVPMNPDKVFFDMDRHQLILVWSGNYKVKGEFRNIENILCHLPD